MQEWESEMRGGSRTVEEVTLFVFKHVFSHSVWLKVFSIFGENMFLLPNFYEALMISEAE